MAPKGAYIEEEFDDDTQLPLPSRPLPNLGTHGPVLQHVDDQAEAGPASPPLGRSSFVPDPSTPPDEGDSRRRVTDITPYKTWSCIYPIYIDAKRPYGTGSRRIPRTKSVWWPLSKDIAEACARLGLGTLHEVNKSHPRDWENPGRVRVQWKKNNSLINPQIKTKKDLLLAISFQIQLLKPESVPKPPYDVVPEGDANPQQHQPPPSSTLQAKGKLPQSALKSVPPNQAASAHKNGSRRRLPQPPEPHPSLTTRVSSYSPAIASGILIDTVKAGMNATEGGGQVGAASGQGSSLPGKGKRKVIRVRG